MSTHELNVQAPKIVRGDLVWLFNRYPVPPDMRPDSQHSYTQLADVSKDLWETLLRQQLESMQEA